MTEEQKPQLHIESDWKTEAQAEKERLSEEEPRIQVDADWKAQAQAEKEKLAAREGKTTPAARPGAPDAQELPEPSFRALISVLASQAIMGLGVMTDRETGGVIIDLDSASFGIELLGILEEKTKGNLEAQESTELTQTLAELRSRFVQITRMLSEQAKAQPG